MRISSSSATTLTVASIQSSARSCASCSRFDIRAGFVCSVVTTSRGRLRRCTAFTTSAFGSTALPPCGSCLWRCSTTCRSRPRSMARFSAHTQGSRRLLTSSTKFRHSTAPKKFRTRGLSVTSSGRIRMTVWDGGSRREVLDTPSALISPSSSTNATASISSSALTSSLWRAFSGRTRSSVLRYSALRTTATAVVIRPPS
mmetsp:Transcript_12863/g.27103  ORF Transcript_12863/g.27103 Transcript_12863/m.27103 type:complete len:200 (-) Transcript_12863:386-985(-)